MQMQNMKNNQIVSFALRMWGNYIQTGDVHMSPQDCENIGKKSKIKPLDTDQMEFVCRLNRLADDFLKSD